MTDKEVQANLNDIEDTTPDDGTSTDTAANNPSSDTGDDLTGTTASELQAQIDQLKKEVQANLQGWQRARAEFKNYKTRTQKELREARNRGALEAIGKFLPIIDDFQRALANIPDDLEEHPWVSGTSMILKKFDRVLEEYDVEEVDPVGSDFDPNLHEAVMMEDSDDYESGVVTATLQKGYKSGDEVLRPALVRVAN